MLMLTNLFRVSQLTYYARAEASRLTSPSVHIEIGVTVRTPLAEDSGACVNHIDEIRVRRVQIVRSIVSHIENDSRIQTYRNKAMTL